MTMDKEYIEREALIENLNKFAPEHYNALINMLIQKAPTADVVEVVMCKNCAYSYWLKQTPRTEAFMCGNHNGLYGEIDFNDFCSCGKRKDE
jgi:hypothetical protein